MLQDLEKLPRFDQRDDLLEAYTAVRDEPGILLRVKIVVHPCPDYDNVCLLSTLRSVHV